MKNKEVKGVKEVQGVLSPFRSESVASRRAQGVQDITLEDIIGAARELRDEENAQISAKDLDQLISIAPNTDHVGTRRAALGQQSANNPHTSTHHPAKRPYWWATAACLLGFLAGFGVKSALPSGNSLAVVPPTESTPYVLPYSAEEGLGVVAKTNTPTPAVSPDTILLREIIHDTIYQTRVIVRDAESKAIKAVVAKNEQKSEPAETPPSAGCSMLCDDIPYAYLAHN